MNDKTSQPSMKPYELEKDAGQSPAKGIGSSEGYSVPEAATLHYESFAVTEHGLDVPSRFETSSEEFSSSDHVGLGSDNEIFSGSRYRAYSPLPEKTSFWSRAAEYLNSAWSSVRAGLETAQGSTTNFVRTRPYAALGIAVGTGLLLGRFLKKGELK
jgi:hypothetical protein